ncbi:hypothetical protein BC940DRAFT_274692 [Gongronella butleri]|nr:hypothetical protein BC940DRAFT_274692 [Gongronella butleri]
MEAKEVAFSLMVVSIGLSCFVWQTFQAAAMYMQSRKLIHFIVLFQAFLGIIVTFVTLLTPLTPVDCTFRLYFSIIGVNMADIILQSILLWKAYLGNNQSKIILIIGSMPLIGIVVFIGLNITVGRSNTFFQQGVCSTDYPIYIVIVKAALNFSSNAFLSACFLLVIYRHYRILGGSTPVFYTIDWYIASYLIIKQLKAGRRAKMTNEPTRPVEPAFAEDDDEEDMKVSHFEHESAYSVEAASIRMDDFKAPRPNSSAV